MRHRVLNEPVCFKGIELQRKNEKRQTFVYPWSINLTMKLPGTLYSLTTRFRKSCNWRPPSEFSQYHTSWCPSSSTKQTNSEAVCLKVDNRRSGSCTKHLAAEAEQLRWRMMHPRRIHSPGQVDIRRYLFGGTKNKVKITTWVFWEGTGGRMMGFGWSFHVGNRKAALSAFQWATNCF